MSEYIAIQSDPGDFLAHYGVKGMKWGVRKAVAKGNSRALGRQYKKAQKHLAKLEKRANSGKKYVKRAAALGAGAALAGGAAALGTHGVGNLMKRSADTVGAATEGLGKGMRTVGGVMARTGIPGVKNAGAYMMGSGRKLERVGSVKNKKVMRTAGNNLITWGTKSGKNAIGGKMAELAGGTSYVPRDAINGWTGQLIKANDPAHIAKLRSTTNNTYARLGAAGLAAGLGAGAAYNAYRAATTKRAAKKAAQFRSEMNKAFAGTQYANGAPKKTRKRRKQKQ